VLGKIGLKNERFKMKRRLMSVSGVCLMAALALAGCASGGDSNKFMTTAAQGGMAEVQLGRLAAERGSSEAVKQFGQHMVMDHSKANQELTTLAQRKNVSLPQEVNSDQKSEADKLAKLSGADFDKEYIDYMVKDHEEDAKEFQEQSKEGKDADVKAFAAKTLPVIQGHLKMAQEIKGK
jgi:putative membrane protein